MGSNVVGAEELALAEEDVAGREKFVGEALGAFGAVNGSFQVCEKLAISKDRFGSGGIAGILVSGDSGLSPEGLTAPALFAARSPFPLTLPGRL